MDSGESSSAALLTGVRIAVDVGSVRIGVAASDPEGRLAFPVATIRRDSPDALGEVLALIAERDVTTVFVGLPRNLDGSEGESARQSRDFAASLGERTTAVVRLIDERFSTSTASAGMRSAGRSAREQRDVIDQAAAVVILDFALDIEKRGNLDSVTEVVAPKGSHE